MATFIRSLAPQTREAESAEKAADACMKVRRVLVFMKNLLCIQRRFTPACYRYRQKISPMNAYSFETKTDSSRAGSGLFTDKTRVESRTITRVGIVNCCGFLSGACSRFKTNSAKWRPNSSG